MKTIHWITLASAGFWLAGCSTVRYSTDYDRSASFQSYATYDWLAPSEDEQAELARVNPFLERRLQRAVDAELARRGFVRDTEGDPDFLVTVYSPVPVKREAARRPYRASRVSVALGFGFGSRYPYRHGFGYPYFSYPYFGYPYFGYPYYGFPGYFWYPGLRGGHYSVAGYGYPGTRALDGPRPGTIIVDVVDAGTNQLAWRGSAEGALLEAPDPDELTEYIDKVVAKIMKEFPPRPRSE
jgi:hypothetical protein